MCACVRACVCVLAFVYVCVCVHVYVYACDIFTAAKLKGQQDQP